jgi:hypothetical protein
MSQIIFDSEMQALDYLIELYRKKTLNEDYIFLFESVQNIFIFSSVLGFKQNKAVARAPIIRKNGGFHVIVEAKESSFHFTFRSQKTVCEKILKPCGESFFDHFIDFKFKESFPPDPEYVHSCLNEIKSYFLKKMK